MARMLTMLVQYWQEMLIVLTAFFAILGLTGEYKLKDSNKLTSRGRVFLILTIVSTCLGLIVQKRQDDANERAHQSSDKFNKETLKQLSRLLEPLAEPNLSLILNVDCKSDKYKDFCGFAKKNEIGKVTNPFRKNIEAGHDSSGYSSSDIADEIELPIHLQATFFANTRDFEKFLDNRRKGASVDGDFGSAQYEISFELSDTSGQLNFRVIPDADGFDLSELAFVPKVFTIDKKMSSLVDIPGSTLVLEGDSGGLDGLIPTFFEIGTRAGDSKATTNFVRMHVGSSDIYVSVFPPEEDVN